MLKTSFLRYKWPARCLCSCCLRLGFLWRLQDDVTTFFGSVFDTAHVLFDVFCQISQRRRSLFENLQQHNRFVNSHPRYAKEGNLIKLRIATIFVRRHLVLSSVSHDSNIFGSIWAKQHCYWSSFGLVCWLKRQPLSQWPVSVVWTRSLARVRKKKSNKQKRIHKRRPIISFSCLVRSTENY